MSVFGEPVVRKQRVIVDVAFYMRGGAKTGN